MHTVVVRILFPDDFYFSTFSRHFCIENHQLLVTLLSKVIMQLNQRNIHERTIKRVWGPLKKLLNTSCKTFYIL